MSIQDGKQYLFLNLLQPVINMLPQCSHGEALPMEALQQRALFLLMGLHTVQDVVQ